MKCEGQLVVITGGGHGIGRGLAHRFAQEGARHVAVIDLDGEAAHSVASECCINQCKGSGHQADVGNRTQLLDCIDRIVEPHGPIDMFFSNAGIGVGGGLDTDDATWQKLWNVNVHSHIWAAQAVIPSMIERGGGTIISTASAAGLLTNIGAFPYAVTKHAAVAVAEWLSVTYGDNGIQVACLCPMGVETQLLDDSGELQALLRPGALSVDAVVDATMAGIETGTFLILPHGEVSKFMRHKASDPDRWLGSMRTLQKHLGLGPSKG